MSPSPRIQQAVPFSTFPPTIDFNHNSILKKSEKEWPLNYEVDLENEDFEGLFESSSALQRSFSLTAEEASLVEKLLCPDVSELRPRSSSLNLNLIKPEQTSEEKKIVRFADSLGLDLTRVKVFSQEDPITTPVCSLDIGRFHVTNHVDIDDVDVLDANIPKLRQVLIPTFHQPIHAPDFFERLDSQKVVLENCGLRYTNQIHGSVRVKNIDFSKRVVVRFTYDEWLTWEEVEAYYVQNSCDGFSDRFEFNLCIDPSKIMDGKGLNFACRYECGSQEFWDNNCNRNYCFVSLSMN